MYFTFIEQVEVYIYFTFHISPKETCESLLYLDYLLVSPFSTLKCEMYFTVYSLVLIIVEDRRTVETGDCWLARCCIVEKIIEKIRQKC